ncbi:type III secretion system protein SctP [Burkholderia lata]|uniref:type III secretion system protein SctP n=1 Tax=Burkholderia lata (strain ATCC 17760 / DSM 23089 / LMG 22485 / NCIMB 9086 / R18194 / 383) TaxID=482957 RepID=UPI001453252C|nr:type III secretion system protein SctP [Burkholderia lata]VWB88583.1 type III secretion protein [Burkholderia lata]
MSERTRNAGEVRIVPGISVPVTTSARGTTGLLAVQLFRALAAQATGDTTAHSDISCAPADQSTEAAPQEWAPEPTQVPSSDAAPPRVPSTAHDESPPEPPVVEFPRDPTLTPASSSAVRENASGTDTVLGEHIVRMCASAAHGEFLAQKLTERITRFCAMSGAGNDVVCAVTLPINPAVLEDTLLHLQLSPSRLAIRFETSNAYSAQLICDNVDALRARLSDALFRQIDVDVTL